MTEAILLTAARVLTFIGPWGLTNASGFFFQRDERLFLVTSRHVLCDEASKHFPDRIEIELHIDPDDLAQSTGFSIPLFRDGRSIWRQGCDSAGDIDVAAIEIDRAALPPGMVYRAFTPDHLLDRPVAGQGDLPWMLLGIHSSRLDMGTRDRTVDEALGLNCVWYAEILATLTDG